MKLSEAIRVGASKTGQCAGDFTDDRGNTCALGAAYLGLFDEMPTPKKDEHRSTWREIAGTLGFDYHMIVTNPQDDTKERLDQIIVDLNDRHDWTRERIADWLETLGY